MQTEGGRSTCSQRLRTAILPVLLTLKPQVDSSLVWTLAGWRGGADPAATLDVHGQTPRRGLGCVADCTRNPAVQDRPRFGLSSRLVSNHGDHGWRLILDGWEQDGREGGSLGRITANRRRLG